VFQVGDRTLSGGRVSSSPAPHMWHHAIRAVKTSCHVGIGWVQCEGGQMKKSVRMSSGFHPARSIGTARQRRPR